MRRVFVCLMILLSGELVAQRKQEVKEFTGVLKSYSVGMMFAYDYLTIQMNGGEERGFLFHPKYGTLLTSNLKPGSNVSLKSNTFTPSPSIDHKGDSYMEILQRYLSRDYIVSILINDTWQDLAEIKPTPVSPEVSLFLEKKIEEITVIEDRCIAFRFDRNKVGYYFAVRKDLVDKLKSGRVSFNSFMHLNTEGFVYPMNNVASAYFYRPLERVEGVLKSFLFKQNHVCIGAAFTANDGREIKVSFPSDKAKEIKEFIEVGKTYRIYHSTFKVESQLTPRELQALVSGKDTLKIGVADFYGGADVKHDFKDIVSTGKITSLDKDDSGRIMSIIVDDEFYIEIDNRFEKQIGVLLKRGETLSVTGLERVKKAGEIYKEDFRIITPQQITIGGKVYLLQQQP